MPTRVLNAARPAPSPAPPTAPSFAPIPEGIGDIGRHDNRHVQSPQQQPFITAAAVDNTNPHNG